MCAHQRLASGALGAARSTAADAKTARATMARRIDALLLDEPFTGLDRALRDELIADLIVWQEKSRVPILSVTHDVTEAFQLGAEVIKIAEGRVVQARVAPGR